MTDEIKWQEVHTELQNLYSELDQEQSKLFTRAMALKNKLHGLKDLIRTVEHQISKEEDSDSAAEYD